MKALAANPNRRRNVVQRMLEALIAGQRLDPARLSRDELVALTTVISWLEGIIDGLPDLGALQRRLVHEDLLEPLHRLAGATFVDRESSLDQLRDYVGVIPSTGVVGRLRRYAVQAWYSLAERPPLFVHGPGGIGKSALISRFILEHVEARGGEPLPFVYIDVDRPGVDPEQPATLLVEAVRQLGPQLERFDDLARDFVDELTLRIGRLDASDSFKSYLPLDELVANVCRSIVPLLGKRPLLFVLDTFEEVQFLGEEVASIAYSFLSGLQKQLPQLRIVLSGRMLPRGLNVAALPLAELKTPDAARLLAQHIRQEGGKMPEPSVIDTALRRIGGNPMCLRLAGRLIAREGPQALREPTAREGLFRRLETETIQARLYGRLLSHIHDPRIRKLAFPGLIVRRVTPELIVDVLAEPCGLPPTNLIEAAELVAEMSKEIEVVEAEPVDGGLRHRPEIRKLMLKGLDDSVPDATVRTINEKAVAFWSRRNGAFARAEELYHRLRLEQPESELDAHWDPLAAPHLRSALDELPDASRLWLAGKLEVSLDHSARTATDQEAWEAQTARIAERYLRANHAAEALTVLRERGERRPGSELLRLETEALLILGRFDEATRLVESAISARDDSLEGQRDLLWNYGKLGDMRRLQSDIAGALTAYHQALAIARRLAAGDPRNVDWQRAIEASWSKIGDVCQAGGNLGEALAAYDEALVIARRLAAKAPDNADLQRDLAACLSNIGDVHQARGEFTRAVEPYEEALRIARRVAAEDEGNAEWQRGVLVSLNKIADIQRACGDLTQALAAYERGIAIARKLVVKDPDNIEWRRDLAVSLTKIGDVCIANGDLPRALRSFEQALKIREELVRADPDNAQFQRDLAVSQQRVGWVRRSQGDTSEALEAFERSHSIVEGLSAADPGNVQWQRDLAISLSNLGEVRRANGDLALALDTFESGHALFERLAARDPRNAEWQRDLSVSLQRIGEVRRAQGDLGGALSALEGSHAIFERLAASDPRNVEWQRDLAVTLQWMGEVRAAEGDLAAARPLFERALTIREKFLEPEHPEMAASLDNTALILQAQGDFAAARPLFERALAIRDRVFGPEHPSTATSLNNLALLLQDQGDFAQARSLFERALAIREKLFGPEHPDTATNLNNLAVVLRDQGHLAQARLLNERALAISEKVLGPNHPSTATSLNNLAVVLQDLGDLAQARRLLERALAIRERSLGSEHPAVATNLNNLGLLLRQEGHVAGALNALERSCAILKRLSDRDPGNAELQRDLAVSYINLGEVRQALGDHSGALAELTMAQTTAAQLAARDQSSASWRDQIASLISKATKLLGSRETTPQGSDSSTGSGAHAREVKGNRSVAIGGDAVGSTIVSGDSNVVFVGRKPSQSIEIEGGVGQIRRLEQRLELDLLQALSFEIKGELAAARNVALNCEQIAHAQNLPVHRLRGLVAEIRCLRKMGRSYDPIRRKRIRVSLTLTKQLGLSVLRSHPVVFRELAAEVGKVAPEVLQDAVRTLGLEGIERLSSDRLAAFLQAMSVQSDIIEKLQTRDSSAIARFAQSVVTRALEARGNKQQHAANLVIELLREIVEMTLHRTQAQ
jgi:tetratricopeptide (TPR) repeat protein